jgi:Putative phage holin Dp-1
MQLKGRLYDVLKVLAQIYIPAAGTLYFALAQIWHLPEVAEVTGTVVAIDTFLGALLSLSSLSYKSSNDKYDGTLTLIPGEDGSALHLTSVDPVALTTKDEILFKVIQPAMTSTPPPTMDPRLIQPPK